MLPVVIDAKNLGFSIPIFRPSERKIGRNPVRMMTSFYSNKSERNIKSLLSNINFEIHAGEKIGVMGKNGAGKTTLLRLLCGVYKPNIGQLNVTGKVHGLFDFQTGMRPEATGLENIYLRGLQMEISLNEIKGLVPDVIDFAGIGDAINDIFQTYSTGMKLRLATAISTMIDPDILVMDEWVGSGDEDFKKKLDKRMNEIIDDSRALVIASHSKDLIQGLCDKVLVLDGGSSIFFGDTREGIEVYMSS